MAYNGYLIKIKGANNNDWIVPGRYIRFNTYQVFMSVTDLDSFRDQEGRLQRTALAHRPNKCEFETPAMLTSTEFATLMSEIRSRYTNSAERKANVELYIPELDSYVTQEMYMPDIQPSIYWENPQTGLLQYNPIRLAFIGY